MARVPILCLCGNSKDEPVSEKDGYTVVKCLRCGLIRTSEREEDYESLYTDGLRYHVEEMDKIGRDHYAGRFDHDYDLAYELRIPALLIELRSLDVGCANGGFVAAMNALGFSAEGLEVNPIIAAKAAEESGATVHVSWDTVKGVFDVMTYNDVFEHIVDPRAELVRAREFLRPDGLLVIDCPDGAEVFGPDARAPHHQKNSQHLYYYTEHDLRRLLAEAQFVVTRVDRPIVGKVVVYSRKNGD